MEKIFKDFQGRVATLLIANLLPSLLREEFRKLVNSWQNYKQEQFLVSCFCISPCI